MSQLFMWFWLFPERVLMKHSNLNASMELRNSRQQREVHRCGAVTQAFCSTIRLFLSPHWTAVLLALVTCYSYHLLFSNCHLCGKELIYLKHYQKPYAVTKKSTKEIFLLCNCQSGIHILNKLRRNIILLKNGEENGCFWPTPLFRVVLKNNFCYLGAG